MVENGQFSRNEYALLCTCLSKTTRMFFEGQDRTIRPEHGEIPWWAILAQLESGHRDDRWLIATLVRTDSLETLKKLCRMSTRFVGDYDTLVRLAGEHGSTAILNWLLDKRRANGDASYEAARDGRLEDLIWAHQKGVKIASHAYQAAAMKGHVHVLEWLKCMKSAGARIAFYDSDVVNMAATCGHVHVLEWCKTNRVGRKEFCGVLMAATICNREGVIAWARENGFDSGEAISSFFACVE